MASTNEPNQRIPLRVLGLSYQEIKKGAHALILAEVNGPHYIPIVIGTAEAQSIAMRLENIKPPRPITHDLFATFTHAFGIRLLEVFIHKFEDGIFASELIFMAPDGHEVTMDARTSDAIAIAMRTGSPIFTTPAIIEETGFTMEEQHREPIHERIEEIRFGHIDPDSDADEETMDSLAEEEAELELLPLEELEERLAGLIAAERYEEAARLSQIIKQRKSSGNQA